MSVVIIIRIIITYVTGNCIALPNRGESSLHFNLRCSMKPSLELRFYEQEGEKWHNEYSTRIFHEVLKKKKDTTGPWNFTLATWKWLVYETLVWLALQVAEAPEFTYLQGFHRQGLESPSAAKLLFATWAHGEETWPLQPQHPHIPIGHSAQTTIIGHWSFLLSWVQSPDSRRMKSTSLTWNSV